MKKTISLTGFLVALLVLATAIEASDNSTVNYNANSNITAHTVCKKVTNNSPTGLSVYVPTQSSAEWASFYGSPPAGVTIGSCGPATTQVIFLTSGSSWTVPADWNPSNNSIEVIGGGGGGGSATYSYGGGGGGGGAYSWVANVTLIADSIVAYGVGRGGDTSSNGEDTFFCNSSSNCASILGTAVAVGAKGGTAGGVPTQGIGGPALSGVGVVRYSGGNGGPGWGSNGGGGGGGGGGAGPDGNGAVGGRGGSHGGGGGGANGGGAGGDAVVGSTYGGPNRFGTGGGSGSGQAGGNGSNGGGGGGSKNTPGTNPLPPGGNGSQEDVWIQTSGGAVAGPGSGAGGSGGPMNRNQAGNGGVAGSYGGAGAGAGGTRWGGRGVGSAGAPGIIVITYGP